MNRNHKLFLHDIIQAMSEIEQFTQSMDEDDFLLDRRTQLAVLKNFEIIGEAVKNLSLDFRKENIHIPWEDMAGMRDVIVHEYFGIDFHIVWRTVRNDIKDLKNEISELL